MTHAHDDSPAPAQGRPLSLTRQQAALLAFIRSELDQGRPAPSYAEMADHLGLSSLSGIHRLVRGLEARGLIRRLAGCARSIAPVLEAAKPGQVLLALPEYTYRRAEACAVTAGIPVAELVSGLVLDGLRHPAFSRLLRSDNTMTTTPMAAETVPGAPDRAPISLAGRAGIAPAGKGGQR